MRCGFREHRLKFQFSHSLSVTLGKRPTHGFFLVCLFFVLVKLQRCYI